MAGTVDNIVMSDNEEDFSEAICAICDNGGDVICCEGKCLRAFHATVEAGSDAACDSLGFSKKQIKEIETFKCENCKYNQHPCYICGKLGSSDKSAGTEVFQCDTRTCGYFYHPSCVANALQLKYEDEPKNIEAEIASGKTFTCPLHFCYACKETEPEYEADLPMQFAVCRRCPRAYHRKCLPGTIAFQADSDKGIHQRAWDELISNKVLIYCMEHNIDDELLTPLRSHIIFPHSGLKKEKPDLESDPEGKVVPRKRLHPSKGFKKKTVSKLFQRTEKSSKEKQLDKSSSAWERRNSGPYSLRDRKLLKKRRFLKKNKTSSMKAHYELKREANTLENNSSPGRDLNAPLSNEDSDAIKLESRKSSGSGKRSKACKSVEGNKDSVATTKWENQEKSSNEVLINEKSKEMKMENGESCSSKKRSRSSDVVLGNENPKETNLKNGESCSSSKKRRRSAIGEAEAENNTAESVDISMNSCDMHNSGTPSRTGYMSLGFAPGPCRPFSEYSSAGWLDE